MAGGGTEDRIRRQGRRQQRHRHVAGPTHVPSVSFRWCRGGTWWRLPAPLASPNRLQPHAFRGVTVGGKQGRFHLLAGFGRDLVLDFLERDEVRAMLRMPFEEAAQIFRLFVETPLVVLIVEIG